MGKKKSVVFMILLTIVTVVLCAITAFPAFAVPNSVKKWNPAVLQYDLGTDLGGGYYAYYYPEGVISENEFKNLNSEEDRNEYVRHGATGLYLSTDEDYGIFAEDGKVSEGFKTAFQTTVDKLARRFAKRAQLSSSDIRVAVVDDYAIRVDLPASETTEGQTSLQHVSQALSLFALNGALTIKQGDDVITELQDDDSKIQDVVKSISVKTKYEVAYLHIKFTKAGKAMLEKFVDANGSTDATTGSTATTLDFVVGEEKLMSVSSDYITTKNEIQYPVANESDSLYAETMSILLNSAMEEDAVFLNDNENAPFEFRAIATNEIRSYEPVYGDNVLVMVYVAILIALVAIIALGVWKMGRFGVVNAYVSLTYLVITALFFAFITGGVFEITFGSVLTFLIGLVVVNVLQAYIYSAMQSEFAQGKTVASSVKNGYKKTLWGVIDVYAVALLGALALLIGVAGVQTLAVQTIICVLAGAFCNLLWGRAINFTFLSASKDKFKYFRFVREDDDDE